MAKATLEIRGTIGDVPEKLQKELEGLGVGSNFTAEMFRNFLKEPETIEAEELEITIDTPGGDVQNGFEIYDLINAIKRTGKKITTIGKRYDSIGSVLFLSGDVRKSVKGAKPLIHAAWIDANELGDFKLNAQKLDKMKRYYDLADNQILAVYGSVAGRNKLEELQVLMQAETELTDEQIKNLNFATEIISGGVIKEKSRAMAFNSSFINQNQNEMSEEKLNAIEKTVNALRAFVGVKLKNQRVTLADGTEIFVDSEDGEFEGKRAVLVQDGMPTDMPAPEGTHRLGDGREIVVGADGIISAVKEEVSQEEAIAQAVAAKEEEMKAAYAAEKLAMDEKKEEEMNALKASNEKALGEFKTQLSEVQAALKALKDEVPGDPEKTKQANKLKALAEFEKETEEMTKSQKRMAAYKREKLQNQNTK